MKPFCRHVALLQAVHFPIIHGVTASAKGRTRPFGELFSFCVPQTFYWKVGTRLSAALHPIHSLLCLATNQTPQMRLYSFSGRAMFGVTNRAVMLSSCFLAIPPTVHPDEISQRQRKYCFYFRSCPLPENGAATFNQSERVWNFRFWERVTSGGALNSGNSDETAVSMPGPVLRQSIRTFRPSQRFGECVNWFVATVCCFSLWRVAFLLRVACVDILRYSVIFRER